MWKYRAFFIAVRSASRKLDVISARYSSISEASAVPTSVVNEISPSTQSGFQSPNIARLVEEIANLTLLEVADLNKALKQKLNLPDTPMFAASSMMATSAAPAKQDDEDTAPAVSATKTKFNVKLTKIDDSKKIAVIKEVKATVPNLNLVQAKKLVESLPQTIKSDLLKDEAEKLVAQFSAHGATCEID